MEKEQLKKFLSSGTEAWYPYFRSAAAETFAYRLMIVWVLLPEIAAVGKLVAWSVRAAAGEDAALPGFISSTFFWLFQVLGVIAAVVTLFYLIAVLSRRGYAKTLLRREPWHFLLLLMGVLSVVSTLLALSPAEQFMGHEGELSFLVWLCAYACALLVTDEKHRLSLLRLYGWSAMLQTAVMFLQMWGVWHFGDIFISPRAAAFAQFNHMGYYLCMGITVLTGLYLHDPKRRLRPLHLLCMAVQVYALVLNDTFGAFLGACVGVLAVYVFFMLSGARPARGAKKTAWLDAAAPLAVFVLLSVLGVFGLLPSPSGLSWGRNFSTLGSDVTNIVTSSPANATGAGTGRMGLWLMAVKVIKMRPIFGFGAVGMDNSPLWPSVETKPHNELLQYAVYYGIPAALAYLAALVTLAVRRWKELKTLKPSYLIAAGGVVAYLASSMFGCALYYTAPYLFLFLGLLAAHGPEPVETAPDIPPEENASQTPKKSVRLKQMLILLGIVALLAASVAVYFQHYREQKSEEADLSRMELAHNEALALYMMDELAPGMYWYDVESFSFFPVEDTSQTPAPYGMGTEKNGGAVYDRDAWDYDTRADYSGMLMQVTVRAAEEDGCDIAVEWVPAS